MKVKKKVTKDMCKYKIEYVQCLCCEKFYPVLIPLTCQDCMDKNLGEFAKNSEEILEYYDVFKKNR